MTWYRTTRQILLSIEQKANHIMTALEDLQTAITNLEGEETAAAAEFTVLAGEIKELKAGTITEAQVAALAEKATAVGNALKAATPEGKL